MKGVQKHPLAAAEESLESYRGSARAAVHAGALEPADRAGLVPEGSFSTVLGVPPASAGPSPPGEVDEFGDALAAGADQEVRQDVAFPFGRHSCLDQNLACVPDW